jgi:hypothetical protein
MGCNVMSSGTEEPTVSTFPVVGGSGSFERLVIFYFSKRSHIPKKISYFDSHCREDLKFHITSRLLNDRFHLKTKVTVVYHRTFRLTLRDISQFNTWKLKPRLFYLKHRINKWTIVCKIVLYKLASSVISRFRCCDKRRISPHPLPPKKQKNP